LEAAIVKTKILVIFWRCILNWLRRLWTNETRCMKRVVETILTHSRRGPVVLVFSDLTYLSVLENWLAHAKSLAIDRIVIVALGQETREALTGQGVPVVVLPSVASLRDLWILRAELFAALAEHGVDFIHSDADAIWLKSPVHEIFDLPADLVFSQGTIWPHDIVDSWGFVVCCGLFGVRGNTATANFFSAVVDRIGREGDDQVAVNRELGARSIRWDIMPPSDRLDWNGRSFKIFDRAFYGHCETLKVALLPYNRFPRLPMDTTGVVVAHPLSAKEASNKVDELRRLGLWKVQE
jgi:hypothetical protein